MAQEQTANPFYDFMYGKYLLKTYFDITMHEDDYVEMAYNIFRDIGNIATSVHSFKFTVDSTCVVPLPCNVEFIESVSTGTITSDMTDSTIVWDQNIAINPNYNLPDVIRNPRANVSTIGNTDSNLKPEGQYMGYNLAGTMGNMHLQFDKNQIGGEGVCIYRGMIVDTDGNPLLNRKEAEAIAFKIAFLDTQKKVFMNEESALKRLSYIQGESGRKMAAAKIPEYVSQNQWDRMFSAMTSHDRKVYWSSYKSVS